MNNTINKIYTSFWIFNECGIFIHPNFYDSNWRIGKWTMRRFILNRIEKNKGTLLKILSTVTKCILMTNQTKNLKPLRVSIIIGVKIIIFFNFLFKVVYLPFNASLSHANWPFSGSSLSFEYSPSFLRLETNHKQRVHPHVNRANTNKNIDTINMICLEWLETETKTKCSKVIIWKT